MTLPGPRSGRGCRHRARYALALLVMGAITPAHAETASRSLMVEVRVVDEANPAGAAAAEAGLSVSSRRGAAAATQFQSIRVLNGQRGVLQFSRSVPFQWVRSAAAFPSRGASGGSGGAVENETSWLPSGQRLAVRPRWAGGRAAVVVEIEVDAADLEPSTGAPMPARSRRHVATTLAAPMGRWTSFATTGPAPDADRNTWSTGAADVRPQVLQVRVEPVP